MRRFSSVLSVPPALRIALSATLILSPIAFAPRTAAGTCATNCPPAVLQFVPGQAITVQVKNRTNQTINIEKVQGTKPISLTAGQGLQFERSGNTITNLSVVWEAEAFPLRAVVTQPNSRTLRIELIAGSQPPGDRAVYLKNDGRVEIL